MKGEMMHWMENSWMKVILINDVIIDVIRFSPTYGWVILANQIDWFCTLLRYQY